MSLPLLLIEVKSFYLLLQSKCSSRSQVLLKGNCCIYSCIFVVYTGKRDFSLFLCQHLGLSIDVRHCRLKDIGKCYLPPVLLTGSKQANHLNLADVLLVFLFLFLFFRLLYFRSFWPSKARLICLCPKDLSFSLFLSFLKACYNVGSALWLPGWCLLLGLL